MQKFIGSKFFVWDEEMSTEAGEPPLCNTSDLNEGKKLALICTLYYS